jgi:hypothetical protein
MTQTYFMLFINLCSPNKIVGSITKTKK